MWKLTAVICILSLCVVLISTQLTPEEEELLRKKAEELKRREEEKLRELELRERELQLQKILKLRELEAQRLARIQHPAYKEICETLKHLKKDYLRFLRLHKDIVAQIPDGTNGNFMTILDNMWRNFARLNSLICDLEEKKKQMEDGTLNPDNIEILENLMTWTGEILGQTAALFDDVQSLRAAMRKSNGVVNATLVEELAKTIATCLEVAQDRPIALMIERSEFFMEKLPGLDSKFASICKKIRELQALCQQLLSAFKDIRKLLLEKFGNRVLDYPSQVQYEFCKCIFQLCRLVAKLRKICEMAENGGDMVEIEKLICDWLVEAMEVRESLRDCLEAIPGSLQNSILAIPGGKKVKINGIKKKTAAKRCFDKVTKIVGGIIARFDKCIRKIRCAYIEIVKMRLLPIEVPDEKTIDQEAKIA